MREILENAISTSTTASGWERLKAHISSGKGDSNKLDVLANVDIAGKPFHREDGDTEIN